MKLLTTHDTVIKRSKKQSSLLSDSEKLSVPKNTEIEVNWTQPSGDHVLVELKEPVKGFYNWFIYSGHIQREKEQYKELVTLEQARFVFGSRVTPDLNRQFNECLIRFDITTVPRIRHFMAQIGHESGGLRWFAEIASGADYEGRRDLGNVYPGDGRRFKG